MLKLPKCDGKKESTESADLQSPNILLVTLEGLLVGGLTGFVGAGGGFLIIPALVLLTKMEKKNAVATSLLIIAVKSLFGFLGDLGNLQIDWLFIAILSFVSFAGLFVGKKIGEKISGSKLKKGFGYFVLVMGVYIIFKSVSTS